MKAFFRPAFPTLLFVVCTAAPGIDVDQTRKMLEISSTRGRWSPPLRNIPRDGRFTEAGSSSYSFLPTSLTDMVLFTRQCVPSAGSSVRRGRLSRHSFRSAGFFTP